MILAVYVIGPAIALIVLTIRLRDTRDQLGRMRRERNTYARTIEAALPAPATKDLTVTSADGSARPIHCMVSGGDAR
jgi:hypothetical protein